MNNTKKLLLFSFLILFITIFFIIKSLGEFKNSSVQTTQNYYNKVTKQNDKPSKKLQVYQNGKLIQDFDSFDDAVDFAESLTYASIKDTTTAKWLWDNFPPYNVFINDSDQYVEYNYLVDAIKYASMHDNAYIYSRKTQSLVWTNTTEIRQKVLIEDVPIIQQYPELPRGCEVTSLAMLLNFKGIDVDKMELAEKIKKDPTPYEIKNNQIYFGNPNDGFVGDMQNKSNNGLGVYHAPIKELMEKYLPKDTLDLTGVQFDHLLYYLNEGVPVWIISNSTFAPLSNDFFETWVTPSGEISITYKEHSVLITGYDEKYIYFNNPLSRYPNDKALKDEFIQAWEQMGRQAITYYP